jgi:hypothetical protein
LGQVVLQQKRLGRQHTQYQFYGNLPNEKMQFPLKKRHGRVVIGAKTSQTPIIFTRNCSTRRLLCVFDLQANFRRIQNKGGIYEATWVQGANGDSKWRFVHAGARVGHDFPMHITTQHEQRNTCGNGQMRR